MARKSRKNAVSPEPATKPAEKVWYAALYIRLSSEFNGGRGDSLETQQQIMEGHLALYPDIEIIEIYTDNGVSGQTFERAAFQKMLHDVETGKINCIVTKDLSRLGRNVIDTGYYIEKYFPLHHVRFIAVNDQYDSEDAENSANHLIVPLKNMINEAYAVDIGKKVRSQIHQSMLEGAYIGGKAPYGYRKAPDNCHHLIINEETAPVVRQMFQWRAEGATRFEIVRRLNGSNVLSPGHYLASIGEITNPKLIGSGKWSVTVVKRILSDQVYIGDMVRGRTRVVGRKQIFTDPSEWIIVPNTHEPLIDRSLFEKVQAIQAADTQKFKNHAAIVPFTKNILRGRIFCGCCGSRMSRTRCSTDFAFYCTANIQVARGYCVGKNYLLEQALFQMIIAVIQQQAKIIVGNRIKLESRSGRIASEKKAANREISKLRQTVENNQSFLAGLYENFVSGVLTKAEYLEMKEGYQKKIANAIGQIHQIQECQQELEKQVQEYIFLSDQFAKVNMDTELTEQMVDQMIERVIVNSPNDITVHFRFENGFDRVQEVLSDG